MKFKKILFFLLIAGLIVGLAACGSDAEEEDTGDENTEEETEENETSTESASEENSESEELEGSVVIDGSGTVYPLMSRLAEEYMLNEQSGVSVEVGRAGTSAGFEQFLQEDGTDFNDASRQIKEEEQAAADELGIEVKELKVALDGLTFVVHPDNDWATEMTPEELTSIFLADGGVETWSDVNPEWPDEEVWWTPLSRHKFYKNKVGSLV